MTNMLDKNIQQIGYNFLNLPNAFSIDNNNKIQLFLYRADGTKLRKIFNSIDDSNGQLFSTISEYIDGFHNLQTQGIAQIGNDPLEFAYEQESFLRELRIRPTPKLQFFPTAEGFYDNEKNEYIYQYKDHLGNVRLSYKNNNNIPEITDQNDFYPFGMNIPREEKSIIGAGSLYNYKYNGKELQETGMYDYGARFYMSDIGRWGVVDPLAEFSRRTSPYNYALNNPIRFIDPDGMKVINGDQASRDEAEKQKNTAQNNFNKQYGGNRKMKKSDFSNTNKSDWKSYKNTRKDLQKSEKSFAEADDKYQHTQQSIDNFKNVDPDGFAQADNLTYKNKAGDVKTLDIIVSTIENATKLGGGGTEFSVNPNTGDIIGNRSTTKLGINISVTSNKLAHEFGHSISLSVNSITYAEEVKANPSLDCQLRVNRNSIFSKTAVDWQKRYDKLYKEYKKN